MNNVVHGGCLEVLRTLAGNSIDSIVTDPPYGLSFMGRKWDYDVPSVEIWAECLRVLKPGGHLLAFAGTRTQHRMAVRIEDAGFEIRDMIAWVYGSGFPKSLDVSKAIDKAAGAEGGKGAVVGKSGSARNSMAGDFAGGEYHEYLPATDAARQWQGWGTALKPALEPITVARKPLIGTVAENVLAHGTGAINVDGCRVEGRERTDYGLQNSVRSEGNTYGEPSASADFDSTKGRWPANLIHDSSEELTELLGEAARFFYCAKASKKDRDEGLEKFGPQTVGDGRAIAADNAYQRGKTERHNTHPTVKPTDLMRYLCRLVTPPGGVVLDPFTGSGSTGKAATLEGFRFIGIEREAEYAAIARARIDAAIQDFYADLV